VPRPGSPSSQPPSSSGLGPLLFECARLLDEVAQAEVNREAGRRLLTPALVRLLPHLSRDGVRPTELARRIEVSKQAVGQALRELERLKFVELVIDPADGRARLVRLTVAGAAAYAQGHDVLAFYEAALAERIGSRQVAAVREGLVRMLPVLESWVAAGAPIRDTPRRSPVGRLPRRAAAGRTPRHAPKR
jgi:DNA-binding MarR family transcriptional regulator